MRYTLFGLWVFLWSRVAGAEERRACLIGNAEYAQEELKTPKHNVALIQSALEYANFEVLSLVDGKRRATKAFLKRCVKRAKDADVFFFYYSGHGLHVDARNRILPVGARIEKKKDIVSKGIDIDQFLLDVHTKERIFILDINRTQPRFGAVKGWRIPQTIPPQTVYILGTAPGMTDYGENRRTGVYAEEFGSLLPRPDLDWVSLFQEIHRSVKKRTRNQQIPFLQTDLDAKRYFFDAKRTVQKLNIPVEYIRVRPFVMGCTSNQDRVCNEDERPAHPVELSRNFYMMRTEVTQNLYTQISGVNPSHFLGEQRPVEKVSWREAILFANRLSMMEGRELCYQFEGEEVTWRNPNCAGWRLPTEAEWEFAARADERHIFSGGDYLDDIAWYAGNSEAQTHPVCQKKKNQFQLCDMSGNVLEWVWDRYGVYEVPAKINPMGAIEGRQRIIRGGSWYYTAWGFRVSRRFSLAETAKANDCGFRLVRY